MKCHHILEEDSAYRIEKLLVAANDVRFPTTSHWFNLNFMGITTCSCTPIQTYEIPNNHFLFMPFTDILPSSKEDQRIG